MFCSFHLILYIIWVHFSLSLSPFYYFDYYEHQYFTSVLFHMFSFIKNALFGSYSWMSHRTFIESSAVTTAFWLGQYGGRFASIFRCCPPSMFWGQCNFRAWCLRGDVPPIRSLKILYFCNWNRAIWWILSGTNLEKANGKKQSSFGLTDQNFAFGRKCW